MKRIRLARVNGASIAYWPRPIPITLSQKPRD